MDENPARKRPIYAIQRAFRTGVTPAEALLADGTNLRFKFGRVDTGWVQPDIYAPLAGSYRPRVVITLDLARLRDVFLNHC